MCVCVCVGGGGGISKGFIIGWNYISKAYLTNFGRHGLPLSAGLTTLKLYVYTPRHADWPMSGAGGRAYERKFCQVWEADVKKECNEVAVD